MELVTFYFKANQGWSVPAFPDLDSENTAVIVFGAPSFIDQPKPIQELIAHYPRSQIIGCSTAGEIFDAHIYDESIVVSVIKFKKTYCKTVALDITDASQSYAVGQQIREKLAEKYHDQPLQAIFVLSNGLNVNGAELARALNLNNKNDSKVVVTGGLAGDGSAFKRTWTLHQGQLKVNQIVALGFYGSALRIGYGSQGGWKVFGPERIITGSQNNILYKLDQRSALDLYKEYLGEHAKGLPATGLLFPLAIRENSENSRQLVRTILAVDEATQSLTFAGDMPIGYRAQLMRADFESLIDGAEQAGQKTSEQLQSLAQFSNTVQNRSPILALAISCVGRRLLLGERTEEETAATMKTFPTNTQQIGFYSYGELSPFGVGSCELHNQTMTLTLLSEAE